MNLKQEDIKLYTATLFDYGVLMHVDVDIQNAHEKASSFTSGVAALDKMF